MQGIQQNTAESTRLKALRGIPGISERMASRMVYGRSGVMDDEDPSVLRSALADYLKTPSREAAARAIEAGANLNQFPDRFLGVEQGPNGELPIKQPTPARGTPEYYDMLREEGDIGTERLQREAPIRARASADNRAPQRRRTGRVTGPKGEIGLLDLDTGEVDWTGEMGARPGGSSIYEDMMEARRVRADTSASAAPTPWPVPLARAAPAEQAPTQAPVVPDQEITLATAARNRLKARGVKNITIEMLRAEMNAIGSSRGR